MIDFINTDAPNIVNFDDFDPASKEEKKLKHVLAPLHLKQGDYSGEACLKRYDLYMSLRECNPKGFRPLPTSKHNQKVFDENDRFAMIAKRANDFIGEQRKKEMISFNTDIPVQVAESKTDVVENSSNITDRIESANLSTGAN